MIRSHPSRPLLYGICLALLALLALTFALSFVNLGPFNTPVALAISVAKGLLVVLFFMNLRSDTPVTRIFAGMGVFWLAIMFTLALCDFLTRSRMP